MMATKLIALFAVVSYAGAVEVASRSTARSKAVLDEQALAHCVTEAKLFITEPVHKVLAIEKATDSCALDHRIDDRNYVCPHYNELLKGAFARESTDKEYTAESFCQLVEDYVTAMFTAPSVPNVGTGSLFNFKVAPTCETTVAKSIAPSIALAGTAVPDFWYAMCMSQDCAHFLPSRTRWCTVNKAPSNYASVCEGIRTYAKDEEDIVAKKEMTPAEICGIYAEFVAETNIDIEAYMHVIHHSHKHRVPTPEDMGRALSSSRLINDAGAHAIRDGAGDYVEPMTAAKSSAVLKSALALSSFFVLVLLHV